MLRPNLLARRLFSKSTISRILSPEFKLEKEWNERIAQLGEFQMGGSYEWISAVQKKFTGDGRASAIDVDAAVCIADEQDQVEDVMELVYKLRHTSNTSDTLPSTSYGVIRFLLKYDQLDEVFKILDDPVNYGVFPDEHAFCLLIDHLLEKDNIPGAAKVATFVMQQEMFDNELLNLVSVYSLLRFIELPKDQRVFAQIASDKEAATEGGEDMDEEITFRFPYLRNHYNDRHFDLSTENELVAKSLDWFSAHSKPEWSSSIQLIAAILNKDLAKVQKILEKKEKLEDSAVVLAKKLVEELVGTAENGVTEVKEGEEKAEKPAESEWEGIKALLPNPESTKPFSDLILSHIKSTQKDLESTLTSQQKTDFQKWAARRKELIHGQAELLDLQLQLKEIENERRLAQEEIQLLHFFDNRVSWEDKAKEMDRLFHEFKLDAEDEALTEEVYGRTIFDKVRDERKMAEHAKKY
ncbi:unnamed protein product [Bursaphelenchus xylophilus]|uniref:(pine wood nematode) hypothetical protein n=1 Tax=Bursaphelenchus xylophilus TaxID=6326 RepID=A0A1I7S0D5_BURXY|nr:unnamed protein product [Bursaphelenchus xylophilus]CAG9132218.1 unnamed protein product [Bursaphelenchus xylophilus]